MLWWYTWRCAQVIGRRWFENIQKLSNTIYNTGEWPQDFTEVKMIALKKKKKKVQNAATIAQSALLHIQQR